MLAEEIVSTSSLSTHVYEHSCACVHTDTDTPSHTLHTHTQPSDSLTAELAAYENKWGGL